MPHFEIFFQFFNKILQMSKNPQLWTLNHQFFSINPQFFSPSKLNFSWNIISQSTTTSIRVPCSQMGFLGIFFILNKIKQLLPCNLPACESQEYKKIAEGWFSRQATKRIFFNEMKNAKNENFEIMKVEEMK